MIFLLIKTQGSLRYILSLRRKHKHQFDKIDWPETVNHHARNHEPPFSELASFDHSYPPSGGALSATNRSAYHDYPSPQPAKWSCLAPPLPGGLSVSSYASAGPQTVLSHYSGSEAALLATGVLERPPSAMMSSTVSAHLGIGQTRTGQPQLQVVNGLEVASENSGLDSHAAERLEKKTKAQLREEDHASEGEAEAPPPAYSAG